MIKYPQPIQKNAKIGLTATSDGLRSSFDYERLDNAIENVKNLGYTIKETDNIRTRNSNDLVSADAETRAKQLMTLWQDDSIACIMQPCGGEFLMEILPFLNEEEINKGIPKWICGYSDLSLLNFYMTTNHHIATVTCDNFTQFGMKPLHESLLGVLQILSSHEDSIQNSFALYENEKPPMEQRVVTGTYYLTEKVVYRHLYDKQADTLKGRLIGGCIDVLSPVVGTPFDKTKAFCEGYESTLWYLENCSLDIASLYRTLWQMKQAGWFNNASGFIIGRTKAQTPIGDFRYADALHRVFDDLHVPVIYDIDTGHAAPQWTMVNGSLAEFQYSDGKGTITQHMV